MNPSSVQTQTTIYTDRRSAGTRLHGPWLILARGLWIVLGLLAVRNFVVSLIVYAERLSTLCISRPCVLPQLSPEIAQVLPHLGLSLNSYATLMIVYIGTSWLICLGVGVLLFWRKSDDWMVLLVATMLVAHVGGDPTALALSTPAWLVSSIWFVASVTLGLVFTLFPDGRFVPHWMRWLMIGWILLAICLFFNDAPFSVSHWPVLLQSAAGLAAYGGYGCIIATQIYRYRHVSDRVQRQKIKWVILAITLFLLAVIAVVLGLIPLLILFPSLGVSSTFLQLFSFTRLVLMTGVFLLIPLSFAIAVLRHRLWDIDIILNRTLVYGILTFSVVGLYVLIVGTLGSLFQAQGNLLISLLATGLIAVLFQPLRSRLQRAVNRLMFGERDEPYAVLSRLGQRLEATLAPDAVLPMLTETVAQALKLPYAAIGLLQDGGLTIVASYFQSPQAGPENTWSGTAPPERKDTPETRTGQVGMHYGGEADVSLRLPLVYQSEQIGELLLAARSPGEAFTPADRRLLDDLARQAGIAAHAVRLTVDLQHSRERLVTAREEERRRLRRDLHDGLGPQLASQTLTLTAARKLLRQDPEAAETLLTDAITHAQQAVTDIRRLVYNLRPPALDDLGLLGALREQMDQYRSSEVALTLEAPEQLPPLSAAVEVACYRIAQEALTNVMRHACAHSCTIRLTLADRLTLEITDDGTGLSPGRQAGVGLTSMRERATELGGTCIVESVPGGGTRVSARLPLS